MKKFGLLLLLGITFVGCDSNEQCDSKARELIGITAGELLWFNTDNLSNEDKESLKMSTFAFIPFMEKSENGGKFTCSDLNIIKTHGTKIRTIVNKYK